MPASGDLALGRHDRGDPLDGRGGIVAHLVERAVERPRRHLEAVAHQADLALHDRVVRLGGGGVDRGLVGRLGDAEVHAGDDREGDAEDHLERRVDHAVGAVGQHPLVGHEHVLERDAVAGRAAHAEGVPVVEDGDALRRDRHRHVQHPAALLGVVVGEHRRHHGAGRRLAAEHLAARHHGSRRRPWWPRRGGGSGRRRRWRRARCPPPRPGAGWPRRPACRAGSARR